jgi:hypothetical protein
MAENRSAIPGPAAQMPLNPQPHPALRRLDRLVGTWELKGSTLDSQGETIIGHMTAEWILGGFFLQLRGEMAAEAFQVQSIEILGYDPASDTFPSMVYSNLEGVPTPYRWDVQGDVVTHWEKTSKYTGTFSADGNTLSGGWRPNPGVESNPGNTYDAVMVRVK